MIVGGVAVVSTHLERYRRNVAHVDPRVRQLRIQFEGQMEKANGKRRERERDRVPPSDSRCSCVCK